MKLFACIDSETTGLPGVDALNGMKSEDFVEAVQVCILPLTDAFIQDKTYLPFKVQLRPAKFRDTPEYRAAIAPAMAVNRLSIDELMQKGMDRYKAADMLVEWWEKVTGSEAMSPLAQNFPFDKYMLTDWLGQKTFNLLFNRFYRDTYSAATFLSDRASAEMHQKPFPEGFRLEKLCKALGVSNEGAHDAFVDCIRTAECYRRMLHYQTVHKGA